MPTTTPSIEIFHGRRWPVGLTRAAARLNITANHLRLVLTGERRSAAVLTGYSELCVELTGKPFKRTTRPGAKKGDSPIRRAA